MNAAVLLFDFSVFVFPSFFAVCHITVCICWRAGKSRVGFDVEKADII